MRIGKEGESTGTKYMAANCEGSQSPPRTVELRKKKKNLLYISSVLLKDSLSWQLRVITSAWATS
jgi:hypothetical protein